MAHSLKLKVVAEGIETEAQLDMLWRENCDEGQGYLFSPPLTAESITELLQTRQPYSAVLDLHA
jgi:EAL domain-containing protein (putative c-di-GMP-specific phosphodiesterase class I)